MPGRAARLTPETSDGIINRDFPVVPRVFPYAAAKMILSAGLEALEEVGLE